MKAPFALPVIIIALASAGAIVMATGNDSSPTEVSSHHDSIDHHHSHNDHVAFTDMSALAAHRIGGVALHEDDLESNSEWKADWELHTIDIIHNGHALRVYHAINRHNPDMRFIATWDTEDSTATSWEPAR